MCTHMQMCTLEKACNLFLSKYKMFKCWDFFLPLRVMMTDIPDQVEGCLSARERDIWNGSGPKLEEHSLDSRNYHDLKNNFKKLSWKTLYQLLKEPKFSNLKVIYLICYWHSECFLLFIKRHSPIAWLCFPLKHHIRKPLWKKQTWDLCFVFTNCQENSFTALPFNTNLPNKNIIGYT